MTRALGIDIGHFFIKVAEVEYSGRTRDIVGLHEIPCMPGDAPGPLLANFFARSALKYDRLAMGLGSTVVFVRTFEFPFSDAKRVSPAINSELEDALSFDFSEHGLDVRPLRKVASLNRFLVGLCPRPVLDALNAIVEQAGLNPTAFFIDAEALGHLALSQELPLSKPGAVFAVLDIGQSATKIALIRGPGRDPQAKKAPPGPADYGQVCEFRTLDQGSAELVHFIAKSRHIDEEEALAWLQNRAQIKSDGTQATNAESVSDELSDEIKNALRAILVEAYQTIQSFRAKTDEVCTGMYLTGKMSELSGLRNFLSEELKLQVFPWPIFLGYNTNRVSISPEKERSFASALALAHKFVERKSEGWLNFRRSPQASRKILTTALAKLLTPQFRPLALGLSCVLAVTVVYSNVVGFYLQTDSEQLTEELLSEFRRLDRDSARKVEKSSDDLSFLRSTFETLKKSKLKASAQEEGGASGRSRSNIVLGFSQSLTNEVMLRALSIDHSDKDNIEAQLELKEPPTDADQETFKTKTATTLKSKGYSNVVVEFNATDKRMAKLMANWEKVGL